MIKGISIGRDVVIEKGATINVKEGSIGDRSVIRSGVRIEGNKVVIGREAFLDYGAWIGGGSCWDEEAFLVAGNWLHMGWNSQINIARGVQIGNEVGIGIETKIFTHGAYLSAVDGFPAQWGSVEIGNNVWLPNAWVNPNVKIGNNVVVTARSLIRKDLPDGCLAGGIPVRIIKEKAYPKIFSNETKINKLKNIFEPFEHDICIQLNCESEIYIFINSAIFNITNKTIKGFVSDETRLVKEQLRRNGIRFKYTEKKGVYTPWSEY